MGRGGVRAGANLRGGGEYGKAGHVAGRLSHKQNVFDDFIAAGEYLIEEGITTKDQLAIQGGSNGGLLVGAVVNQRPDLFAAALPPAGVMDILRFDRFTARRPWVEDSGYPSAEAAFKHLIGSTPLLNIERKTCYPPVVDTDNPHDQTEPHR